MTIEQPNDIRCPVCLAEFNLQAVHARRYTDCPHCHTKIEPVKKSHDGYVHLNWQEVRILTTYAHRWAMRFDLSKKGNMDSIIALERTILKLNQYRPNDAEPLVKSHKREPIQAERKSVVSPYFYGL